MTNADESLIINQYDYLIKWQNSKECQVMIMLKNIPAKTSNHESKNIFIAGPDNPDLNCL